jgi:hypothetical protein
MKKLLLNSISTLVLFILYSCSDRLNDLKISNSESFLISIEEAKGFYQNIGNKSFTNVRVGNSDKPVLRQVLWSQSQTLKFTNGQSVVVVPALYNNDRRLNVYDSEKSNFKNKNKSGLFSESKFLFYKNKDGNIQGYLTTIISSEKDRKTKNFNSKGKNFNGFVVTHSLDEKDFIDGWEYINGKAVNQLGIKSTNNLTIKNARVSQCFETVVETWQPIDDIEAAVLGWGGQSCGSGGGCTEVANIGGIWAKKTGTTSLMICSGGSTSGFSFGSGFVGLSLSTTSGGGGMSGGAVYTPEMVSPIEIDILINARQTIAKNLQFVLAELKTQNPNMSSSEFKIFGEILWDALRKSFPEFIPYASIPMDLGEAYIAFMAGDYVTASINIAGVVAELVPATKGLKIAAKIVEVAPFVYDAYKAISRLSGYDWATNAIIKACRDNTGGFFDVIKWVNNSVGAKIENITGVNFWNNHKSQFSDRPFSLGANPLNPLEQKIVIDSNSWIKFYLESNTTGSPTVHFKINGYDFKIRFAE